MFLIVQRKEFLFDAWTQLVGSRTYATDLFGAMFLTTALNCFHFVTHSDENYLVLTGNESIENR